MSWTRETFDALRPELGARRYVNYMTADGDSVSAAYGPNYEELAPSTGLAMTTHEIVSSPDGNTIKVRLIRPDTTDALPCVYYIHGGAAAPMSAFNGNYRAGRLIAARGVAVAMVDPATRCRRRPHLRSHPSLPRWMTACRA